jgi:hypothetical protein
VLLFVGAHVGLVPQLFQRKAVTYKILSEHDLATSGLNEKGRKPERPVAAFFSICFYCTKLGGNDVPTIFGYFRLWFVGDREFCTGWGA